MTDITTELNRLATALQHAAEMVAIIKEEFNVNGSDSLANIDYGASLNTYLTRAKETMSTLDAAGIFTAGWQPDD